MTYFFDWYLWYFVLLAIFGIVYSYQKTKYIESENGIKLKTEDDYRSSIWFSILVFLPIILLVGYRDFWIGDTSAYVAAYKSLPNSVSDYLKIVDWHDKDPGFYLFSVVIKSLFGADYRIWLIIIAAISGICLAIGYRRYISNVVICAFLFFASADCMGWMMNGMRQFLVAAILFAIFPLLQKKKYIVFIIAVLLLYTVHASCIIVIPLYLCALGKPFNKRTLVIIALSVLAVLFVGNFLNLLDDSLQGTAYSTTVSQFNDDGTNAFRVLVYAVPSILAVIFRKQITDETPEIIKISINMSLIATSIFFISMFTSGIIIGRVPIYFSLFNYILLPWEIKHFFDEQLRKTVWGLMIIFYVIYYCISMSWGTF